jgi:3-methyladenine DNA glycosylase AlkD
MTKTEMMALLKAKRNEAGIRKWKRDSQSGGLKSYGIGLTVLRKLARQIGRDHALAMKLWKSDNYDARVIALLIDDPKLITREQVENLGYGYLAHVFSSCDATLAKAPFVVEFAGDWINSDDSMHRRCGYGLLYEVSKSKKKSAPDDAFFLAWIDHIRKSFSSEVRSVNRSMGVALMGMGVRNRTLHAAALKVASMIGPLEVGSDDSNCKPFDAAGHLTSEITKRRLGLYQSDREPRSRGDE